MKIIFLGTNGWYDTETGNTTCVLMETENYYIVLDAGNGFYKLDQYINKKNEDMSDNKPVNLFLSHFHIDHISGLHSMNKFDFSHGINIYGQPGTGKALNTVINKPYTIPFDELPYKVKIFELTEGWNHLPFKVECRYLPHSSRCLGYRFELDGKVVAYCTDTGFHENAVKLAQDADMLITECSYKIGQKNPQWPHLNPEDAIQIATESKAKRLALTHFDANNYKSLEERDEIELKMGDKFKELIIASDGMEIIV